jgi:glycosyltransferase involved in cell wall biosynthesis
VSTSLQGDGFAPADAVDASSVWIVVPAFNEAPRIGACLDALTSRWPNVVVVDDGSSDGTGAALRGRGVWRVRHTINLGAGAASITGIRFALRRGARYVVTFDADGQHDPGDVQALLAPLVLGHADIVFGSRFLGATHGMPATRRLMLRGAIVFTRLVYGMPVTDAHNGLRAMTSDAASRLKITMNRMEHASEVLERVRELRLRWAEVPVTIRYTPDSLAKGQRTSAAFGLGLRILLEKLIP